MTTTATPPAVELTGVTRSYGPVRAVDDLTLSVPAGQLVALLGPNGAGKSTTNEMILGLAAPQTGTVRVCGLSPAEAIRRGAVGAMLQGGALLDNATVLDTLRLMRGLHRHPLPLAEVIERADCGDFLRTKTDKLSGGQAQRLRFALALLPDPQLLILDEPTVAMDVELRRRFWESMRSFAGDGRTVLFATHYLEEADEVADRIVLLAHGRIVADGTPAVVKASVAGRLVSFRSSSLSEPALQQLPGVTTVERSGDRIRLHTGDSDACVRELLLSTDAHEVEITTPGLTDAFLALTADPAENPVREEVAA